MLSVKCAQNLLNKVTKVRVIFIEKSKSVQTDFFFNVSCLDYIQLHNAFLLLSSLNCMQINGNNAIL